jgi:nitronate monooxygenase
MNHPVVEFLSRFRVPLVAAPMTGVSGFDLVAAATNAGIGGSFPAHNAGTPADLDRWLTDLTQNDGASRGPIIPNLIVHHTSKRLDDDVKVVCSHRVPAAITSVGSPASVMAPLHEANVLVFSDVASMRHVERAIEVGVDGLVLLASGGGGQTGWVNPLAFIRAVRQVWDGPVVLAGGVSDGHAILGALAAGYDLAYMGTAFIATDESAAPSSYRQAVVRASLDDIEVWSGLPRMPNPPRGWKASVVPVSC